MGDLDADAAYALRLQQEEYSRDTMVPMPHRFPLFDADDMVATANRDWGPLGHPFMNGDSDDVAAILQYHAAQQRLRQRPDMPHGLATRRTNPQPSQASDSDGPEVIAIPSFFRHAERPSPYNEDQSDDDVVRFDPTNAFFHMLSNPHRSMHPAFPQHLRGYRSRGSRRGGNLQETEDDFGPEDYEVNILTLIDQCHQYSCFAFI